MEVLVTKVRVFLTGFLIPECFDIEALFKIIGFFHFWWSSFCRQGVKKIPRNCPWQQGTNHQLDRTNQSSLCFEWCSRQRNQGLWKVRGVQKRWRVSDRFARKQSALHTSCWFSGFANVESIVKLRGRDPEASLNTFLLCFLTAWPRLMFRHWASGEVALEA